VELLRRIGAWLTGRRRTHELADEMEAHRAFAQDEFERAGLSRDEAARESRRRMGNTLLAREDSRDVWIVRWADRFRQNFRYGVRGLRREPAFALTAIVTLALGCAATTTVFSVVDSEIWKPLPYPRPHELVSLISRDSAHGSENISVSELAAWRSAAPAFSSIAAEGGDGRRTARLDHAESVYTSYVSSNYFSTLGRQPLLGRVFNEADRSRSGAVILSEKAWRRLFDASPSAIGRQFMLDAESKVIVGVMPQDDTRGGDSEMFMPLPESGPLAGPDGIMLYGVVGRLAPGGTLEVGRAQVQAAIDRLGATDEKRRGHTVDAGDLSAYYRRDDARPLYFFLFASVLVLVLTITNVAGLVLARTIKRAPEFALRGALGGGLRALGAQLVVEACLIAIPGCALGLWLTIQAVGLVARVVPSELLLRGTHIAIDYRVAAFTFVVALVTAVGFVLIPIGIARRSSASAAIASGNRTIGGSSTGRARAALLTAQLAVTVMLLAAAGLFLKSFVGLTHAPLGFDPSDGWSMVLSPTGPQYASDDQMRAFADTLNARTTAIAGIRKSVIVTSSPLKSGWLVMATPPGKDPADPKAAIRTIFRAVGAGYFDVIGTPIVRGRGILGADLAGAPRVAVVSEFFARQAFGDESPIGRRITVRGVRAAGVKAGTLEIVGVAGDIKDIELNEVTNTGDVYVPFAQNPSTQIELIARGAGKDTHVPSALRAAVSAIDPALPINRISAIDRRIDLAIGKDRFNLFLVAAFAIVALLVAAIGIYGAMAYAATARWREFGVRLALGATPRSLLGSGLWQAARLGLMGGVIGIAGALALGVWLGDALYFVRNAHNGLLFNVKVTDPVVLVSALAGVVLLALLSGALPARRIARVNPVQALRGD
jgi:putative ABC transport system permease protein